MSFAVSLVACGHCALAIVAVYDPFAGASDAGILFAFLWWNEFPDAGLGGKLPARELSAMLLTPGALWVTGSCDTETSSVAIYRAMKLSVTLWRAKAARVRAEGGCANRHSPGAVLAQFSEV